MPITEAHAGRRYPPTDPYPVSAAKIAEFAAALDDDNPRYRGESAIAPPTFAALIASPAWRRIFDDPELELSVERIVHGDQRFTFMRPLHADDIVVATVSIDKVRIRGGAELISATVDITGHDAEPICTAQATFSHARQVAT